MITAVVMKGYITILVNLLVLGKSQAAQTAQETKQSSSPGKQYNMYTCTVGCSKVTSVVGSNESTTQ